MDALRNATKFFFVGIILLTIYVLAYNAYPPKNILEVAAYVVIAALFVGMWTSSLPD